MGGFFKIKAHKDNPVQEPLSKGLSMVLLGGCLFYLPSMMDVAGSSLLGADKSASSYEGTTEIV
jgi:intracellular multiplication protein IcmD